MRPTRGTTTAADCKLRGSIASLASEWNASERGGLGDASGERPARAGRDGAPGRRAHGPFDPHPRSHAPPSRSPPRRPSSRLAPTMLRRYVAKRLLIAIPSLLIASIVVFTLPRLIPGDVVQLMLAEKAYAKDLEELRV